MLNLLKRLRLFIHTYDPAKFSLIYSLKAVFALILSGLIAYFCSGLGATVWAINGASNIFFLNAIDGTNKEKFFYLSLFLAVSLAFIFSANYVDAFGVWLFVPTFIWFFIASTSSILSQNLNKVLLGASFTSIIILAFKHSHGSIDSKEIAIGFFIGGVTATLIRVLNFSGYGLFTKRSFSALLDDIILTNNAKNESKFEFWQNKTVQNIANLKNIFSKNSVNLKDTKLIKNHTRAIFYLYKMEELIYCISTIRSRYFSNDDRKTLFNRLQKEIDYNLNELKNLFVKKDVNLKFDTYNRVKSLKEMPIFMASLDVLYNLFKIIVAGGEEKIALKAKRQKLSFVKLKETLNLKNQLFQFSLKYSFAVAFSVFIASVSGINRGMWIALGVVTVMRANATAVKNVTKDAIISTILGMAVGIGIVFVFKDTPEFYLFVLLAAFFIFYLKTFPYTVWNFSLIVALAIYFSIITPNFSDLIFFRFIDMCIGFLIAVIISMTIWPFKSKDELMPKFMQNLTNLSDSIDDMIDVEKKGEFYKNTHKSINGINEFKTVIKESKKSEFLPLYENLKEINLTILKLKSYLSTTQDEDSEITKNDLTMLKRRFEMIQNKINKLPFYFYEDTKELFLNKDTKTLFLMNKIASKQEEIYHFFD